MKSILTSVIVFLTVSIYAQKTIDFPSKDELMMTADLYEAKESNQFIILFHQAGWSRGEYMEIAPKLNEIGYNCFAVDQRSGATVNERVNNTAREAEKKGKKTDFIDAYQDVEAAVAYVKKTYNPEKIIIWGSSYSSSLVLKYAGEYTDAVNGVLSFSPGEYFGKKNFITASAANIKVPVFITSAKKEKNNWIGIYDAITTEKKQFFLPETKGNHGSRALWDRFSDNDSYWKAVKSFLKTI
ncbi:Alpha/beta hydrolase family protein [Aquimarina amphilecti]|uniref:Alpha/beta hydrolase family protein n=1 Tax=Aquimarina amphilecti TaxID=1038014 RepID=A0A1H7UUH3_AQUAM|nr:alpha/beta fold hydrolase [Aquimarina amphilecti]SEM00622.1 Alpha/beta hydrolase family protein [Aquimarina amphilecti]